LLLAYYTHIGLYVFLPGLGGYLENTDLPPLGKGKSGFRVAFVEFGLFISTSASRSSAFRVCAWRYSKMFTLRSGKYAACESFLKCLGEKAHFETTGVSLLAIFISSFLSRAPLAKRTTGCRLQGGRGRSSSELPQFCFLNVISLHGWKSVHGHQTHFYSALVMTAFYDLLWGIDLCQPFQV